MKASTAVPTVLLTALPHMRQQRSPCCSFGHVPLTDPHNPHLLLTSPSPPSLPCHPVLALQARPNSIALFVPAEITTYAFYTGKELNYWVANAIFRMGGAAVLLTNKASYARTAKYSLQYNVRVHTGQDDEAYG